MADTDYKAELRKLGEKLRDPGRMRVVVCGLAVAIAYFAIYGTLDGRITQSSREVKEAKRLQSLQEDIQILRAQAAEIQPRVAAERDANESVQYVLDGIRGFPLQLLRFDSGTAVSVGPYEAIVLQIEVRGKLQNLDGLLAWLETNYRLFRVDSMKLQPPNGQISDPTLRLTVLGLKVK